MSKPSFWSRPRPISIAQLNALLHLHMQPINLITYQGPYLLKAMGNLILGLVSRLDAFSAYLFQTQLLSHATGVTTDTPAVCPFRSSRTKNSSLQISCAHGG